MSITFDAHEVSALAVDIGKVGVQSTKAMVEVFKESGDKLSNAWAHNARQTAGVHGKHYPDSIDWEMQASTNIVVEVGPNPTKPQGGMSFEFGSDKQPPHLDGQRAADYEIPEIDRRVNRRLDAILGALNL